MPSNIAAPVELAQQRHFSPWLDQAHTCATCTHAVGTTGPHLWCEHHRIVVVLPCGLWQREPGADDMAR
jgi:hypothetical protein